MHPRPIALVATIAVLLAGCSHGDPDAKPTSSTPATTSMTSTTTSTMGPAPPGFSGEAALDEVKAFALRPDGSPRYRMPGTVGQAEGAAHLWQRMDVPGWERHWQNFTGADYQELDRSAVAGYMAGCKPEDHSRVAQYPFHNLFAIRRGSGVAGTDQDGGGDEPRRLLFLAAHWDSLLHSSHDPDPAKRSQPYPGANDGASGVGLLLAFMRDADLELPYDVGVLFLDGEDGFEACYPLAGSLYFTQNLPVDVHRLLLLDMVGSPEARFLRESHSLQSDPGLVDLLWEHGHALGGAVHFTQRSAAIADDHVAFIQAGIPAVDLIDAARDGTFPPEWHTTMDTVDRLSADMLGLVGDTIVATLHDPRFVAQWPAAAATAP